MNVVQNDQATDELVDVDLPFDFDENAELSWLNQAPTKPSKRRSHELIVEAATAQNTLMLDKSKEPGVDPNDDAYPMLPRAELLKVNHQMAHLPFLKT